MKTECPTCKGRGYVRDEVLYGARMMRLRKKHGLTLREVAARMEKSIGYVSDLEHGRKRWRGGLIAAYVDAVHDFADDY
jgi:predicted transcriptional regulator